MNMFDGMLMDNNVVSWIIMLEIAMHGGIMKKLFFIGCDKRSKR